MADLRQIDFVHSGGDRAKQTAIWRTSLRANGLRIDQTVRTNYGVSGAFYPTSWSGSILGPIADALEVGVFSASDCQDPAADEPAQVI